MSVMEMVHFADMYSYRNVKCLYTFPRLNSVGELKPC
ncbi:terminase large subunit [Staphylococcus phage vB_SauM-V1SA22]|nr:terminase large subunit [Staphylococcus phage vB_SauM-V1SA22]UVT34756.1 terminase large subunit [Staphylococcus phage vB_SauM-V1SA20]